MATKSISKTLIYEALVDFLPEFQKPYRGTKAYAALCDGLFEYLRSSSDDREEKRQILEYLKEMFDDMCRNVPPPPQPDPERRWNSLNR
jgi:hypothetical protein